MCQEVKVNATELGVSYSYLLKKISIFCLHKFL